MPRRTDISSIPAIGASSFPPPSWGRVRVGGTILRVGGAILRVGGAFKTFLSPMMRPWFRPVPCGRTRPTRSGVCGRVFATSRWTDSGSAGKRPSAPMWLISSVSPPGWLWKSTAVNMRSVRIRMPGARDGWRMKGSASSGSGTRRSSGTPKAWPRRSGGHSGTFPHPGDYLPPPRPYPTRGEGGRHSPRPEKSYGVVLPALNSATASSAQRSSWSWVAAIASSQRYSSSRISS